MSVTELMLCYFMLLMSNSLEWNKTMGMIVNTISKQSYSETQLLIFILATQRYYFPLTCGFMPDLPQTATEGEWHAHKMFHHSEEPQWVE